MQRKPCQCTPASPFRHLNDARPATHASSGPAGGSLFSPRLRPRPPPVPREVDAAAGIERDPLRLQSCPLLETGTRLRSHADLAPRVDHPVPGEVASGRKGVQGVTDLTRVPPHSGQDGHLTVCRHAAGGYPGNDRVDPLTKRRGTPQTSGRWDSVHIRAYRARRRSRVIVSRQPGPSAFSHSGPIPRDTSSMRSMSRSGMPRVTPSGRETPACSAMR